MSKVKVALLAGGIVSLVAIVAVLLLMRNLDGLVKHAIETSGSAATGTPVHVGSVSISLREGQGLISGLTIANPPGFSEQPLLILDSISIKLDPKTITNQVPIIEEIRIGASTLHYEINAVGENNLRIVQKYAKRQAQSAPTSQTTPGGGKTESQRLRIKRLVIADGTATLDLGQVGSGQGLARIPGVTLTDLGGEQGATVNELSAAIVQALGEHLKEAVSGGALNRLGDALNDAYRKLLKR